MRKKKNHQKSQQKNQKSIEKSLQKNNQKKICLYSHKASKKKIMKIVKKKDIDAATILRISIFTLRGRPVCSCREDVNYTHIYIYIYLEVWEGPLLP